LRNNSRIQYVVITVKFVVITAYNASMLHAMLHEMLHEKHNETDLIFIIAD
jgi:membrane-bound lytic murein transglycosylase B